MYYNRRGQRATRGCTEMSVSTCTEERLLLHIRSCAVSHTCSPPPIHHPLGLRSGFCHQPLSLRQPRPPGAETKCSLQLPANQPVSCGSLGPLVCLKQPSSEALVTPALLHIPCLPTSLSLLCALGFFCVIFNPGGSLRFSPWTPILFALLHSFHSQLRFRTINARGDFSPHPVIHKPPQNSNLDVSTTPQIQHA